MNVTQAADEADERAGASHRREPLTRERVVEAALRVMDAEGLEAVTMRRIGRELDVEAMSLYNHVRDKEDLLDGVTEMVMGKFHIPEPTGDWVVDARAMAREWRRLLRMHPNVMRLLAERHKPLESMDSFRPMAAALEVIGGLDLPPRDAVQAFNAFGSYIMGFVLMEQGLLLGGERHGEETDQAHERMAEVLRGAGLHRLLEALPYLADCPSDDQFEFGLDLLIGGLRARAGSTD